MCTTHSLVNSARVSASCALRCYNDVAVNVDHEKNATLGTYAFSRQTWFIHAEQMFLSSRFCAAPLRAHHLGSVAPSSKNYEGRKR